MLRNFGTNIVSRTHARFARHSLLALTPALSKKLSIDDIAMYACYVRSPKDSDHEEQDKIDPESGLFTVRDALKLTRESKFRFGIRLPLTAVVENTPKLEARECARTVASFRKLLT